MLRSQQGKKMQIKKFSMQVINLIDTQFDFQKPLKWIYIHGMFRSGTSYLTRKAKSKSKRGYGDWMLHQFAKPMLAVRTREDTRKMNSNRLWKDFRKNLLRSGHIGWGREIDVVVKQATGSVEELKFLTELFKQPPEEIYFLFREPHGWLKSARLKFSNLNELENFEGYYQNSFERFDDIGGKAIVYDDTLPEQMSSDNFFGDVDFSDFHATVVEKEVNLDKLEEVFMQKRAELITAPAGKG